MAAPGQPVTYTLTFSNAGLGTASQVSIRDTIPPTITVTDIFSSGVALHTSGNPPTYGWLVAELAAGEGGVITITGIVDPAATCVFNLTNQVEIQSRTLDANPLDNLES